MAGTGLEWHPKSSHPYVRNFVLMFWNLVKDDRTPEAYAIAKWFYGVDWMKFQVAAEWNCEEPYISKEHVHSWVDSRVCPTWFNDTFLGNLWPEAAGETGRAMRGSFALDKVQLSPVSD